MGIREEGHTQHTALAAVLIRVFCG